jgi:type I restriction enzyme R subunit
MLPIIADKSRSAPACERAGSFQVTQDIINNVRKRIIRDQLTDPRFYDQMSKLLDDLIQQSRADTAAYEEFLRKAEELARRLSRKQPEDGVPAVLHGNREATVIYNNLESLPATTFRYPMPEEALAKFALRLDIVVRESAPAGWKGDQARSAGIERTLSRSRS